MAIRLQEACDIICRMEKVLYLVAGANGSGKSTISTVLLPQKDLEFVNPDDLACEMSPLNPPGVRIEAGRMALARMNGFVASTATCKKLDDHKQDIACSLGLYVRSFDLIFPQSSPMQCR